MINLAGNLFHYKIQNIQEINIKFILLIRFTNTINCISTNRIKRYFYCHSGNLSVAVFKFYYLET